MRAALQAAGSDELFDVRTAAQLEKQRGLLPLNWKPSQEASVGHGAGVLDERVSALQAGRSTHAEFDRAALEPLTRAETLDLRPLLVLLALALLAWERLSAYTVAR